MATNTSRSALRTVTATGLRANVANAVLDALHNSPGGLTGAEINQYVGQGANRRLSELERLGHVHRERARRCSVTGFDAIVWATGPGVPVAARAVPPARLASYGVSGFVEDVERLVTGGGVSDAFASTARWLVTLAAGRRFAP